MPNRPFLLYPDTYEPLKLLSLEEAGELFLAIYDYVINGVVLQTDNRLLAFAFSVFREKLDMDADKYEEVCEKRRKAGRKGSEARWGEPSQDTANATDNNSKMAKMANAINANSKMASVANNNNNTITIQEQYNNKNNKEKNINTSINAKKEQQQMNLAKRKDTFIQSVKAFAPVYGEDMTNDFIDYWTEPNKSGTRMRYELERTWDVSRRLARWAKNNQNHKSNNNNNNENNRTSNGEYESPRERSIRLAEEEFRRQREARGISQEVWESTNVDEIF